MGVILFCCSRLPEWMVSCFIKFLKSLACHRITAIGDVFLDLLHEAMTLNNVEMNNVNVQCDMTLYKFVYLS